MRLWWKVEGCQDNNIVEVPDEELKACQSEWQVQDLLNRKMSSHFEKMKPAYTEAEKKRFVQAWKEG